MTPKQTAFVENYLLDLNATQAYIRAGYVARGNAAEVNAARLLRNAQVQAAIAAAQAVRSAAVGRTAEDVLRDIGKVRAHCMDEIQTEFGPSMRAPKEALRALELEGKHVNIQAFRDKLELTGAGGAPISINVTFQQPNEGAA